MTFITKDQFVTMLSHTDRDVLKQAVSKLDSVMCRCGYVHHWVYNMASGQWNPMLTEKDYELRDVKTKEELYDFLISRNNEPQHS